MCFVASSLLSILQPPHQIIAIEWNVIKPGKTRIFDGWHSGIYQFLCAGKHLVTLTIDDHRFSVEDLVGHAMSTTSGPHNSDFTSSAVRLSGQLSENVLSIICPRNTVPTARRKARNHVREGGRGCRISGFLGSPNSNGK